MISPRLRLILSIIVLPVTLVGCSGRSDTGSPSATGGSGTASAAALGQSVTSATTRPPSSGCAPNGTTIPKGAGKVKSKDLDHDGKRDTLWLADSGTTRRLGVRTASGATFSTKFTSAAPQAATAIGQQLGDGSEIILLNTGRSVLLYAVVDCKIVPSQNAQGKQYTFDLGFTGLGTGVGCVNAGRGLEVAGLLAQAKGSKYTVYETRIALSEAGEQARNITRQTVATKASAASAVVKSAQSVSCGTKNPGANEPKA